MSQHYHYLKRSAIRNIALSLALFGAISVSVPVMASPPAATIYKKMKAIYDTLHSFKGQIVLSYSTQTKTGKAYIVKKQVVAFSAPNKFHEVDTTTVTGAIHQTLHQSVICNGTVVYVISPQQKLYVKVKAPPKASPIALDPLRIDSVMLKGTTTISGTKVYILLAKQKFPPPPPGGSPQQVQSYNNAIKHSPPILLYIDTSNYHLLRLKEGELEQSYEDQQVNGAVELSNFTVSIPKGYKLYTPPTAPGAPGR